MTYPKRNDKIAWRMMGESAVLLELDGKRMFHELNPTATLIWSLADGGHSEEEIARTVESEFEVSPSEAAEDTRNFLSTLSENGLISWG